MNVNDLIKLTKSQYDTLKSSGSITIGGTTYTYDANTVYLVEEEEIQPNPNLLFNPDFKINQRGNGYTSTSYWTSSSKISYTYDRWCGYYSYGSVKGWFDDEGNRVGIVLACADDTTSTDLEFNFRQILTERVDKFAGKTFTLSFSGYVIGGDSDTGSKVTSCDVSAQYRDGQDNDTDFISINIQDASSTEQPKIYSATGTIDSNADVELLFVNICLSENTQLYLNWIKLEIGNDATPFVAPNPAIELLKCQRYYQQFNTSGTSYSSFYASGSTGEEITDQSDTYMDYSIGIPLMCPMWRVPTLVEDNGISPQWKGWCWQQRTISSVSRKSNIGIDLSRQNAANSDNFVDFYGTDCTVTIHGSNTNYITIINRRPEATTLSGHYIYYDRYRSPMTFLLNDIRLDGEIYE